MPTWNFMIVVHFESVPHGLKCRWTCIVMMPHCVMLLPLPLYATGIHSRVTQIQSTSFLFCLVKIVVSQLHFTCNIMVFLFLHLWTVCSQLPLTWPWRNWLNYLVGRIKQHAEKMPKHPADSFGSICPILPRSRIKQAPTFCVCKVEKECENQSEKLMHTQFFLAREVGKGLLCTPRWWLVF